MGTDIIDPLLTSTQLAKACDEECPTKGGRYFMRGAEYVREVYEAQRRKDATDISNLRTLARSLAQRTTCPQCGQGYNERACGPTHLDVALLLDPLPGLERRPGHGWF